MGPLKVPARLNHVAMLWLLLLGCLVAVTGCEPRGETKTLDQVLQLAKDRFEAVSSVELDAKTRSTVDQLANELSELTAKGQQVAAPKVTAVAEALASLTPHAGFTARPALTELAAQYRGLIGAGEGEAQPDVALQARVKLLVARTYNLIASELESTRFRV